MYGHEAPRGRHWEPQRHPPSPQQLIMLAPLTQQQWEERHLANRARLKKLERTTPGWPPATPGYDPGASPVASTEFIGQPAQAPRAPYTRGDTSQTRLPEGWYPCGVAPIAPSTLEAKSWNVDAAPLQVGQRVEVHGLTAAPANNGRVGTTRAWLDAVGRWKVELEPDGTEASIKPANLKPLTQDLDDAFAVATAMGPVGSTLYIPAEEVAGGSRHYRHMHHRYNREDKDLRHGSQQQVTDGNCEAQSQQGQQGQQDGQQPALPAGWAAAVDETSGSMYFMSAALGLSQWAPPEPEPEPIAPPAAGGQVAPGSLLTIAAGWIGLVDPSTGATYYSNESIRRTQWAFPAAPAPAAGFALSTPPTQPAVPTATTPQPRRPHTIVRGMRVEIDGLLAATHVNGMAGTANDWNGETERWEVKLDAQPEAAAVLIRAGNLRAIAPVAGSPAGHGATADTVTKPAAPAPVRAPASDMSANTLKQPNPNLLDVDFWAGGPLRPGPTPQLPKRASLASMLVPPPATEPPSPSPPPPQPPVPMQQAPQRPRPGSVLETAPVLEKPTWARATPFVSVMSPATSPLARPGVGEDGGTRSTPSSPPTDVRGVPVRQRARQAEAAPAWASPASSRARNLSGATKLKYKALVPDDDPLSRALSSSLGDIGVIWSARDGNTKKDNLNDQLNQALGGLGIDALGSAASGSF